jgi:hypothetical protein
MLGQTLKFIESNVQNIEHSLSKDSIPAGENTLAWRLLMIQEELCFKGGDYSRPNSLGEFQGRFKRNTK